jgi:cephalosporin hydroxylase
MGGDMEASQAIENQIAIGYVRFLLEKGASDSHESRQQFCELESVHPKLLYFNPHLRAIASLFTNGETLEQLLDMPVRDWLLYHHHYVHQGYRYGLSELQQQWLGHDILKSPMDCWIYQEIMWRTRPDFVIELGVMFGGASHFFSSLCDLLGHGEVLGIDISLARAKEPQSSRIHYIEGSSTAPEVFEEVATHVRDKKVLIIADSDHEKNHVLAELRLYSRLVPVGCYYVVEDSLNDVMGWHPVPNEGPQAAAREFLAENESFVADRRWAERYLITLNPLGYLLRTKAEASE